YAAIAVWPHVPSQHPQIAGVGLYRGYPRLRILPCEPDCRSADVRSCINNYRQFAGTDYLCVAPGDAVTHSFRLNVVMPREKNLVHNLKVALARANVYRRQAAEVDGPQTLLCDAAEITKPKAPAKPAHFV